MQYQSFPGQSGSSLSVDKLAGLRLPDLAHKRFLDVGCNEGFFCGFAHFSGATEVIGLDKSSAAIRKAQKRFPVCTFLNQSWDQLPDGPFDVILLASALHYAADQEALIHRLASLLSPNGVLVLEVGIAPGSGKRWVDVTRSIDQCLFPTRAMLTKVLKPYAWKIIGHSVKQKGDPLQRYVVHIQPLKPFIYLLLEDSGSGKSTISARLFKDTKTVELSGDVLFKQVIYNKTEAPVALKQLIEARFTEYQVGDETKRSYNWGDITKRIIAAGLLAELVDFWIAHLPENTDAALDSYVPAEHRDEVVRLFSERGFMPVMLNWDQSNSVSSRKQDLQQIEAYEHWLKASKTKLGPEVRVKRQQVAGVRFSLDRPTQASRLLTNEPVAIAGWVVPEKIPQSGMVVFARHHDSYIEVPVKRKRNDVLKKVFGDEVPAEYKSVPVGFQLDVDQAWLKAGFTVGVKVGEDEVQLAEIRGLSEGEATIRAAYRKVRGLLKPVR
ncbi:MAG: methyltransferase domain-containing protein [Alkalimonas sp.]|nr:methyltransferase domain-containing protein [Alkalimonas sp.]